METLFGAVPLRVAAVPQWEVAECSLLPLLAKTGIILLHPFHYPLFRSQPCVPCARICLFRLCPVIFPVCGSVSPCAVPLLSVGAPRFFVFLSMPLRGLRFFV